MAILVSLLLLALFLLIVLPGLAVVWRGKAAGFASVFYCALLLGLGAWHIGMPTQAQADLTRPIMGLTGEQGVATPVCGQVIEQSRAAGIILGRPSPTQVQVSRDYWAQLPDQVKEAIVACLRAPTRPGAPQNEVQVIEVPAR